MSVSEAINNHKPLFGSLGTVLSSAMTMVVPDWMEVLSPIIAFYAQSIGAVFTTVIAIYTIIQIYDRLKGKGKESS